MSQLSELLSRNPAQSQTINSILQKVRLEYGEISMIRILIRRPFTTCNYCPAIREWAFYSGGRKQTKTSKNLDGELDTLLRNPFLYTCTIEYRNKNKEKYHILSSQIIDEVW